MHQALTRFMDSSTGQPTPGSGSAIEFANGGYQVSYDQIAAVDRSRPGEPVKICLVSMPTAARPATPGGGRTMRPTCGPTGRGRFRIRSTCAA